MERYYGVIKNKATASEFLNKLYKASKVSQSSSNVISPIEMLSNYDYLNGIDDDAQKALFDRLYYKGYYAETRTPGQMDTILSMNTKGRDGLELSLDEKTDAEVARFSDRLFLVVRPPLDPGSDIGWSRHLTDIRIVHLFPVTVIPEVQEGEDPPEPITTNHVTEFHLGHSNSNAGAPAVAYEITATKSRDTLVKLAWCPVDAPTTSKELKNIFTQYSIRCYYSKISNSTVIMEHDGSGHTDTDFGAGGPIGGFILHRIKTGGYSTYAFGITVFNGDGSPLYTWTNNARPWDEMDSTHTYAKNVNLGGIGRLISKKTVAEGSEETIVKMAALAPIFCPASSEQADSAKWMPQGLCDYSYFDKTGHIYLKKEENMAGSTPVFFADHGVYLLDGGLDDYRLTDRSLPESYAINTSVIKRPEAPSWLPGYSRFYAIFDCEDGLSESSWLNTLEDSNYDMRFVGTPAINSDGSAKFINGPLGGNSAWCPASFGSSGETHQATICIALIRFVNFAVWEESEHTGQPRYEFLPFLLGYIPGDDIKATLASDPPGISHYGLGQASQLGWGVNSNHYNYSDYSQGFQLRGSITEGAWYILVMGPDGHGSNGQTLSLINSSGQTVLSTGVLGEYLNNHSFNLRFYLGGYNGSDSSWRSSALQLGRPWVNTARAWASSDINLGAPQLGIDCKFLALADASGNSWRYSSQNSQWLSAIISHYNL